MPSLAVKPGQTLGPDDLNLFTRERTTGQFIDPFYVRYTIFEEPGDIPVGSVLRTPSQTDVGRYYASWAVPADIKIGSYVIQWAFKELANTPTVTVRQDFEIVGPNMQTENTIYSDLIAQLIWYIRVGLGDNEPDRTYHFNPPAYEKEINNYSKVFGFIWEDYELVIFADLAMSDINLKPPSTTFTLENFPKAYLGLLVTGAQAKAAGMMMSRWTVDDFEYSIGGKSLSINKASKYEALKSNWESQFAAGIADKKTMVGATVTKGLRQPYYGMGGRMALGPHAGRYVLTARSYAMRGSML